MITLKRLNVVRVVDSEEKAKRLEADGFVRQSEGKKGKKGQGATTPTKGQGGSKSPESPPDPANDGSGAE